MKKIITIFFMFLLIVVSLNIVTADLDNDDGDEKIGAQSSNDNARSEATTRGARAHFEPSDFADYNVYYFISPSDDLLSTNHYLSGAPRISDGADPHINKGTIGMGTNPPNPKTYYYPRQSSQLYELSKNETFDKYRRPFINLTLNSLTTDSKLVQAQVQIDTDGNGIDDAYLNFAPYSTVGNNNDGTQEEEIYEAEGTWQGGTSPGTIKGTIKVVVWQTNQQDEVLILYCGFDYKISWLALPYNHKDLIPVADAGEPEPVEPMEYIHVGDIVEFHGNRSYDPNDDLNSNGIIEPLFGEIDNLKYKWDFGDGIQTDFARSNKRIWHIYTKDKIEKGFEYKVFKVHLWVQDPEGHVDDDWTELTIFRGNHSPTIYSLKINDVEFMSRSSPDYISVVFYQEVYFEARAVDFDEDELFYHWDLDSDGKFDKVGPEENASSFTYIYHPSYIDDNYVKITLMVSDGTPETENDTFSTHINVFENVRPVPIIYAQKEGNENSYYDTIKVRENQKITFYGTDSYDPDNLPGFGSHDSWGNYPLRYKWYFDFENDQGKNSGWLNTDEVEYIYQVENQDLKYTVALEISDGLDTNISAEFTVIINLPPISKAGIFEKSYSGIGSLYTDTPIYFDGSESYDPNNDELNFTWIFGDGSKYSHEIRPVHIYETPGNFIVKLILSDGEFVTEPLKLAVVIKTKPLPPKAVPTISTFQTLTLIEIMFDGSLSYDPDGYYYDPNDPSTFSKDLVKYKWDFGDGNYSTEMNATHAYAHKGVYKATLTVWDRSDIKNTNSQLTIEILNRAPISNPSKTQKLAVVKENVIFSGERSEDIDGEVVEYLWEFGDGSEPFWTDSSKINHSYTEPGTYFVTLQVKDNDGGISEGVSMKVEVNAAPKHSEYDYLLIYGIIAVIIVIVAVIAGIIYIRTRKGI